MKRNLFFLATFILSSILGSAQVAGDYRSVTSGSWNLITTWERYNGTTWVAATDYPGQNTGTGMVTIQNGNTVGFTVSPANPIGSLTIQTGNTATTLPIIGANTLNVSGAVLIEAATGNVDKQITFIGTGTLNCASITMNQGLNDNRRSFLSLGTGTVNVSGNITMGADPDRCLIEFTTGTLNIGGNMTGGTLIPGTGTVNYNHAGGNIDINIPAGYNFHNLTFSTGFPTSEKRLTGASFNVSGTLLIAGAILKTQSVNITLTGGASPAVFHINSSSSVRIDGTGILNTSLGGGDENLILDSGGQLFFVSATATLPVFTNYTVNPFSFVHYEFNGNQTINLPSTTTWGRFSVLSGGIKTLNSDITVTNLEVGPGATLTVANSHRISVAVNSSGNYNFDVIGTFNPGTGKVIFNSGTNNNNPITGPIGAGTLTFHDLEINKTAAGTIRLDRNVDVLNNLTLTSGKIDAQTYILTLSNPTAASQLSGGNANSYLYATGAGRLRRNGLSNVVSNVLFPIGTSSHYLPVTISQSGAATADFAVNAFAPATTNGVQGGPAFPGTAGIVNAVWNIDRPVGSGAADVTINWVNALEGSSFSTYPDGQIGISRHDGSVWTPAIANSASQAGNSVTGTFSSFSPFGIGTLSFALPVKFGTLSASEKLNGIQLDWKVYTEDNVNNYVVERSADAISFTAIGTLPATFSNNGNGDYTFLDASPLPGINFYRIKNVDIDSRSTYSTVIKINRDKSVKGLSLYPNPAVNGVVVLQGSNLIKGKYRLGVVTAIGQEVYNEMFNHNGGAISRSLNVPVSAGKGISFIVVKDEKGTVIFTEKLIRQ